MRRNTRGDEHRFTVVASVAGCGKTCTAADQGFTAVLRSVLSNPFFAPSNVRNGLWIPAVAVSETNNTLTLTAGAIADRAMKSRACGRPAQSSGY